MRDILLIAGFGALGALARYGVGVAMQLWYPTRMPLATLLVNVVGCFVIGALLGPADAVMPVSKELRLVIAVGFLGAFTTFSAFGYETLRLHQEGSFGLAALNIAANVVLGLAAVWCGMHLSRLFHAV
jgi:CrcB protein